MTGTMPSSAGDGSSARHFALTRAWALAIGLFALALVAFSPVHSHDFINYDDPDYVTSNRHVQDGWTIEGIKWAFTRLHGESTYWHPVTWLSHMTDCEIFGLNASWHHLTNVAIHALNVSLLFVLLKRVTGATWRSAAVAALFAVHPLQVDTVAWVAERKNVLSTLFLLITLFCYERYARTRKAAWYAGSLFLYVIGLMTKPMLVTVPGILLLLDFWPLRRFPFSPGEPARSATTPPLAASIPRLFLEKVPFVIFALASAALTVWAHESLGVDPAVRNLSLMARVNNAVVSCARYLEKIFWPHDLTIFYPHPGHWSAALVAGSSLLLAIVSIIALRRWQRSPWLLFGWCWFLGTLLPVLGIVQAGLQAMAERFAYVPIIGVFVATVWGAAELLAKRPGLQAVIAGAALLCSLLVTEQQLRYWRNSETLWRHALAVTDGNFIAEHNLAQLLTMKGEQREAWDHVQRALQLKSNLIEAYYTAGYIKAQQRRYQEAIPYYEKAVELKGDWAAAHRALLEAYYNAGKTNAAIEHLQKLLRIAPDNPGGHLELAQTLVAENRIQEGVREYRETLRLAPDWVGAQNNLAWIMATSPDAGARNGAEAVALAQRACELTGWNQPLFIGTLAAAYAEAGAFDRACEMAEKAATAARTAGQDDIAERNRKLLELYKRNQPYRDNGAP